MRYRGRYRLLPVIDMETNDFPKTPSGRPEEDSEIYITCKSDGKIMAYGTDGHKEMQLAAYVPSLGRGRNIRKSLDKKKVGYYAYDETDEEVRFLFSSKDIDEVASIMGAKVSGANIPPMSDKNLPKDNSIHIPDEDMKRYKSVTSSTGKGRMMLLRNLNTKFMDSVLAKKLKENPRSKKPFDYASDMKRMMLAGKKKEYIYVKGLWDDYIEYLQKNLGELEQDD